MVPKNPQLYDIEIEVLRDSIMLDKITSYFAMRKISIGKDKHGYTKLYLNNEELFHWGL